ncbi:MAG: glycosyltransferase [Acidobacteriota bacterium]
MITIVALLSIAAWIYLIAFHGRFWRSLPVLNAGAPSGNAKLAVIVPARNEAESIRQSLASLLAQDYPAEFAIILVDDNSTDGTATIAASLDAAERLTIINGRPLPHGWSGKLWAVHQGLAHETAKAAGYVLLTDADILHAPDHISSLVARAEASGLDLVSEMVRLHCATAAERALIPAFVFFFQMLYPFHWVADPEKRTAGAAGGTMLASRAAMDRIQGVSRIRHHLIDDCALAKEIKSTGGRIWLGHSERAVSARVYLDWRDIWDMIARTAYVQLRHSPLMLLGCVAGMGSVFCAPPLLALLAHGLPRLLGLLSWLIMALAFQPTLRRYRRSPLWGIALPVISLFYLCATVASALRHYAGTGGGWKNRVYPERPAL